MTLQAGAHQDKFPSCQVRWPLHSGNGDTFLVCHVILVRDKTCTCLISISLIWVNYDRCTCLPNLVVLCLIEMEIKILMSVVTWILGKSWTHHLDLPYYKIFKIRNIVLQFRIPGYGRQKNEKKEKKNKGNSKALCVSRNHNKQRLNVLFFVQKVAMLFLSLHKIYINFTSLFVPLS